MKIAGEEEEARSFAAPGQDNSFRGAGFSNIVHFEIEQPRDSDYTTYDLFLRLIDNRF